MTVRSPIFRKLLLTSLVLIVVTVAALDLLLSRHTANRETGSVQARLSAQADILTGELEAQRGADLAAWTRVAGSRSGCRVTLIGPTGSVLADSEANARKMDNHAGRPEVAVALKGSRGTSVRHSASVGRNLVYVASPLRLEGTAGYVLRLAVPLGQVDMAVAEVRRRLLEASLVAGLLALAIAYFSSRVLSNRIAQLKAFAEKLAHAHFSETLPAGPDDELGALGQSLNSTAAHLERLERVRQDFVANVSHELRTPLAAIQGYTETLLDGALEDRENNRKFLEVIKAHAARLNQIASDLLSLSELESGHDAPPEERVLLRDLIDTALRSVEGEARFRSVTIRHGGAEDDLMLANRLRLEQVLVNLLDNAVKFNRPGGEVWIETAREEDGALRITVGDNGIGIPAEDLPRIFERFYRVDKARSRAVGGTGLGLSIVKHALERMGGRIAVESELGRGSRFTVRLPEQICQNVRDDTNARSGPDTGGRLESR